MEEITLGLRHNLPFSNVSSLFPDSRIFRWCNSYVDYLEIYDRNLDFERFLNEMTEFSESLKSTVVFSSKHKDYGSIMIRCRCSVSNSTVKIAESFGCMVRSPVIYESAVEKITFISMEPEVPSRLFEKYMTIGSIELMEKKKLVSDDLRDVWAISLSDLFSGMSKTQLEILNEAVSRGYYEIPKRTHIENLSSTRGISQSTLQEHLNKAQSRIMKSMEPYLMLYSKYMEARNTEKSK